MANDDQAARGPFRIAAVAELTAVPEPTLRAWERRYGVPSPERTASGYRLYGQAQVDEVRLMRSLCDEGMAAAEAARQVLSRRATNGRAPEVAQELDPYGAAVAAMLASVLEFDVDAFEQEVRRLPLLAGMSTLLDKVVVPFLHEVGQRWQAGDFAIAHERLASQRMSTLLLDLLRLADDDEPSRERILLACFVDEEHELGLFVTAIRLATWGYRPVVLGGRMPPSALHTAVQQVAPNLIGLSLTIPPTRARGRELAEAYGAVCGDVPWLVGGQGAAAVADLVQKFGGRTVVSEQENLRNTVRELVRPGEASHDTPRRKKAR